MTTEQQPRTSLTADLARGVWRVEVIGRTGRFTGVRKTLPLARATARLYAEKFDAPCRVI